MFPGKQLGASIALGQFLIKSNYVQEHGRRARFLRFALGFHCHFVPSNLPCLSTNVPAAGDHAEREGWQFCQMPITANDGSAHYKNSIKKAPSHFALLDVIQFSLNHLERNRLTLRYQKSPLVLNMNFIDGHTGVKRLRDKGIWHFRPCKNCILFWNLDDCLFAKHDFLWESGLVRFGVSVNL